VKIAVAGAA